LFVITLSGNKNASSQGWYFYFDFLECAVTSDVPDPVATTTAVAVATDFDTDNTYKLSPQRLVWNIQKLGLLGEIDHYCGVFWWKQSVIESPPSDFVLARPGQYAVSQPHSPPADPILFLHGFTPTRT
jgi:hypothetical protein